MTKHDTFRHQVYLSVCSTRQPANHLMAQHRNILRTGRRLHARYGEKALREGDRGSATSASACRRLSRAMFFALDVLRHILRHLPNWPRLIQHVQSRLTRDASSTIRNQRSRPLSETRFQNVSKQLVLVASKRWRARIASGTRTKRGS